MKIVALMTVRNEMLFLERSLQHLISQGVEACVIDNGSTDGSAELARRFLGRGVLRVETFPYTGRFDLTAILQNEERLAREIDADWFMHHDADEIREAPQHGQTLHDALEEIDRAGFNAVNFDEFVFIPTQDDGSYENTDYVKKMKRYYFFEPSPIRQIKCWKRSAHPVDLASSGGHRAMFPGRKVYPAAFILRHYIGLSRRHLIWKYSQRDYSPVEVARGWHKERGRFQPERLVLPEGERLKQVTADGVWDRSEPWLEHEFFGLSAQNTVDRKV